MKILRWMIDATTLISFSESRVDVVDSVITQTFLIDGFRSFPEKTNLIMDSSFLITYEHLKGFQIEARRPIRTSESEAPIKKPGLESKLIRNLDSLD